MDTGNVDLKVVTATGTSLPEANGVRLGVPEDRGTPEAEGDRGSELAEVIALPPTAILTKAALARLMHRHPVSIDRAVKRHELPPPTRLCGQRVWTAGAIARYLDGRLNEALEKDEILRRNAP